MRAQHAGPKSPTLLRLTAQAAPTRTEAPVETDYRRSSVVDLPKPEQRELAMEALELLPLTGAAHQRNAMGWLTGKRAKPVLSKMRQTTRSIIQRTKTAAFKLPAEDAGGWSCRRRVAQHERVSTRPQRPPAQRPLGEQAARLCVWGGLPQPFPTTQHSQRAGTSDMASGAQSAQQQQQQHASFKGLPSFKKSQVADACAAVRFREETIDVLEDAGKVKLVVERTCAFSAMPGDRLLAPATGRGAIVSYTQCVRDRSLARCSDRG